MVAERRGVRVIHGANDGIFDVAGYPLTRLRSSLVDAFNIPLDAVALANGRRVPQSYEPVADDVIEFIREQGVKGGRKKVVAEPKVLPDLDIRDEPPDLTTMSLKGLTNFIKKSQANSGEYERMAALVAHKSAVDLFWAGSALSEVRDRCFRERHGKWTEWKKEEGLADSTVNDAIRLFENAKTPDELIGLGITEAKTKFVYSTRDETEQKTKPVKPKSTKRKPASQPRQPIVSEKPDKVDAGESPGEKQEDEGNDFTVIDPAEIVAEALEDIARQLNEITQDDLGKVDLTKQVPARLNKPVRAMCELITTLCKRIDHDFLDEYVRNRRKAEPPNSPPNGNDVIDDDLIYGPIQVNKTESEATVYGKTYPLDIVQLEVLACLVASKGHWITRSDMKDRSLILKDEEHLERIIKALKKTVQSLSPLIVSSFHGYTLLLPDEVG